MNSHAIKLNKSFYGMAATSFLGAFNDNVFRWLMTFFLIARHGGDSETRIVTTIGIVFVTPFLIFTAFAGTLADKISKRTIVVLVKFAELAVMAIGCYAFTTNYDWPLYVVLFLMAAQSAFYGPSKLGIIPELIHPDMLSKANGILEMLVYTAIIVGTGFAIFMSSTAEKYFSGNYSIACLGTLVIAGIGVLSSFLVKKTPAVKDTEKASVFVIKDVWKTIAGIRSDRNLLMTVIAAALFLFIGAFIQQNTIPYGTQTLGLTKTGAGFVFLVMALGIGVGSILSAKISGRGIEMGLVPLGAFGMTATLCIIGIFSLDLTMTRVFVFLLGVSAGLFIVPLNAFIQAYSPHDKLGKIIAASTFLGWTGVLLSSVMLMFFSEVLKMSPRQIFLILGLAMNLITLLTIKFYPALTIRTFCLMIVRSIYRVKAYNNHNVPLKGAALLVCNHVSWVDAFIVSATQTRPVRFIMNREMYSRPMLKPWLDLLNVIPISKDDPPRQLVASLNQAKQALNEGALVCIFAEGAITRTGLPAEFRSGFEKILKGTDHPIIPLYLGGLWGSVFSYYRGKLFGSFPNKLPRPISVYVGEPLPATSTACQIRQKVIELSADYYDDLKVSRRSLADTFVRMARGNWSKNCISDSTEDYLSYGKTLTASIALSEKIKKLSSDSDNVGILLPPSVAGSLTNIAISILGKTSVNLNYTVSAESRDYAVNQCNLKCVISSRRFFDKLDLSAPEQTVYIEDILSQITHSDKFMALMKALFLPRRLLTRFKGRKFSADDSATIIFSSGSTGTPKGVVLSHHNILSNIEAVRAVLNVDHSDDLCAVLPLFHSFGYTCGLWLPIAVGASVTFNPNPLDAKLVGQSAAKHRSTILFAPPTILLGYVRRIDPQDFKSLRIVAAGAEKLKPRLAEAFKKRFNTPILEGYGATELSPVAAFNIPDVVVDDMHQVGNKPGTVGHPLPGIAVRIVDPSTKEVLPFDVEGLIEVKGPNVMTGYLNDTERTKKVLNNGWYDTGDIGKLDVDGFITITDRLSRFSKIGGEMVPHMAIEDLLHEKLAVHEQVVAVTSLPDEKKGEQLVILYTESAEPAEHLQQILDASDLPNMFRPKPANYIKIDQLPLLGSGKLDIMMMRKIALENKTQKCCAE